MVFNVGPGYRLQDSMSNSATGWLLLCYCSKELLRFAHSALGMECVFYSGGVSGSQRNYKITVRKRRSSLSCTELIDFHGIKSLFTSAICLGPCTRRNIEDACSCVFVCISIHFVVLFFYVFNLFPLSGSSEDNP